MAKLATGIADNQALTQVSEAIGTVGVPVVVFPRINAAHARHPAWERHIETWTASSGAHPSQHQAARLAGGTSVSILAHCLL